MAGRIPQSFLDDLVARVDLVDIVSSRITLKKSGKNYTACCPFHTEKTPSFSVSREKQLYYCFGCGAGGNVISFLMDFDRLGFLEVVDDLAASVGLEVPDSGERSDGPSYDHLYRLQQQAATFYQDCLRAPGASEAISYLKRRGMTGATAKRFAIGYAPGAWQSLVGKFDMNSLEEAGLAIRKDGGGYDRFRNRIMFPIRDRRGRVIGFGGRVLDDATPKYLNSPESPVFHKGREVYGLYELLQDAGDFQRILLVEGYMDVVSLSQNGIRNAVACLGTAASRDHFQLLYRYAPELVLCFDGDAAGRRAAWRAVENALPELRDGRQLRVMLLPDGADPDELVMQLGLEGFEEMLDGSSALSDYFFEHLGTNLRLDELEGRSRLADLAKPLLARLPEGVFRELMQTKLAELTGAATRNPAPREAPRRVLPQGRKDESLQLSPARVAIILLLQNPALLQVLESEMDGRLLASEEPGVVFLMRARKVLLENPGITPAGLMEFFRSHKESALITRLLTMELLVPREGVEGEFVGALHRLKADLREKRLNSLVAKAAEPGGMSESEREEMRRLLAGSS